MREKNERRGRRKNGRKQTRGNRRGETRKERDILYTQFQRDGYDSAQREKRSEREKEEELTGDLDGLV